MDNLTTTLGDPINVGYRCLKRSRKLTNICESQHFEQLAIEGPKYSSLFGLISGPIHTSPIIELDFVPGGFRTDDVVTFDGVAVMGGVMTKEEIMQEMSENEAVEEEFEVRKVEIVKLY